MESNHRDGLMARKNRLTDERPLFSNTCLIFDSCLLSSTLRK